MKKLELFIKEKGVNISEMERILEITPKSIKLERGIPQKHMEKIVGYLKENFGYDGITPMGEVDVPEGKPDKVVQKRWNKNFIPPYKDGIQRYQDPENGLWKRLLQWQTYVDSKTGEIVYNQKFFPLGTEKFEDNWGEYVLAKNGIKVYSFPKETI